MQFLSARRVFSVSMWFLLLLLSSSLFAQIQSTLQATLFYEDTNATFRGFNQPMVDHNGNVIVFGTQFGLDCPFDVCGVVIYSIAPNGTPNWIKPDTGFAAPTVNQVAIGLDDTIYFQGFPALSLVFAYDRTGHPVPNWPVISDLPLDTAPKTLLVDPLDGSIIVKRGTSFSFSTFPGRITSYRPDGSEKWPPANFPQMANNTPGMFIGPNDDIYTYADRTVIVHGSDGSVACQATDRSFAPLAGGSTGVFSEAGPNILKINPDCTATVFFSSDRGTIALADYDNGIVFATDFPSVPFDPTKIRLIGVKPDGTFWRNEDFIFNSIGAKSNSTLYVIGTDVVDQKQKLFLVDENSGATLNAFDTTGFCGSCGVAVGIDGAIYVTDLGSTKIYLVSPTDIRPAKPTHLGVVVGDGSAYLQWDEASAPVDEYQITITRADGATRTILLNPPFLDPFKANQATSTIISSLNNSVSHQIIVVAIKNGISSLSSDPITAVPNTKAGNVPDHPSNPILFLHGWSGNGSTSGTFSDTIRFFSNTLQWNYGGELIHAGDEENTSLDIFGNAVPDLLTGTISSGLPQGIISHEADFLTAQFGNNYGDYADKTGLFHQGEEVGIFIQKIVNDGIKKPIILVGHSDGGLAARDYITRPGADLSHITGMVTYGTPHRGADPSSWTEIIPHIFPIELTQGFQDSVFDCSGPSPVYRTSFLNELNSSSRMLPPQMQYATIFGIFNSFRPADCHSSAWDILVPASSADLSQATSVVSPSTHIRRFQTRHKHFGQGGDFATILCAVSPGCTQIFALSPVELDVIAPDGSHMRPDLSQIVGASYQSIQDTSTHTTTAVTIPFPLGGEYKVVPIPKPGAGPNDTFTIKIEQNEQTQVLAQDVRIQDIPAEGYHQTVNAFPIAVAGADQTVECSVPGGANVTLNGTASHDPDGDPLSFQWTDEQGNAVGTAALSNVFVPLGTHLFKLTVQDGRGGFGVSYVAVKVQDTTAPSLAVSLFPNILHPPNHKFVPITATLTVNDACDANSQVKLVSITSSEIDPRGFVLGADVGTADVSFQLRADRLNEAAGRTYMITYSATDSSGNSTLKTVQVVVPRDDDHKP